MPLTSRRVLRVFRYAMYFDGVDDYVEISASPSLYSFSAFTIMIDTAMIGINRFTARLFGKWQYWKSAGEFLLYIDGFRKIFFEMVNDAGTSYIFSTDITAPLSTWSSIGITYDGSMLKLYLNGAYTGKSLSATGTLTRSEWIRISAPSTWQYNGYVSRVLMYSRALSAPEISWNYNYPDNPVRNGLVLWLHACPDCVKDIDGDGVLEWIDLSGYGNHGKIYGAQLVQLVKTRQRLLTSLRTLQVVR